VAEPPIRLVDVGKRYTKYEDSPMLVTAALRFRTRTRRSQLWAIRHIDLEVAPGECLGVIGRNGSGKSTMLQMLAGVTAPTEGRITVQGRVAPLISVGVGFHPELTGRENVYVNGTVLGLSRSQIDAKFDDIVAFSEIGAFIDTPVKFYSSGMFVRLGFSVAVHAEPEVLLIDEVLAVGDLAFQMKCFDRMTAIREAGATVVIVTHNLNAVRRLCDRAMLLHDGAVAYSGEPGEAISRFHDVLGEDRDPDQNEGLGRRKTRSGVGVIESFELVGPDGEPTRHVGEGEQPCFRLRARFDEAVDNPRFGFAVVTETGINAYSDGSGETAGHFEPGDRLTCTITVNTPLVSGSYSAVAGLHDEGFAELDSAKPVLFYVSGRSMVRGIVDMAARFDVQPDPPA
jgi:lipopolysaccharide transport system ATP-binding protein